MGPEPISSKVPEHPMIRESQVHGVTAHLPYRAESSQTCEAKVPWLHGATASQLCSTRSPQLHANRVSQHNGTAASQLHRAEASQGWSELSEARAFQLHGAISCVSFSAGYIYPQCPMSRSRREGGSGCLPWLSPLPEPMSVQGQHEHTPLPTHHLRSQPRGTCGAQTCFSNP